jgi:hypothetical protein
MKVFKLLVIFLTFIGQSCATQTEKINGVSFVASRDAINEEHVNPVVNIHSNYASLMPFGFIKDLAHPEVVFNTERQWLGERVDGIKQYAGELRIKGVKIMIKPQIWVWRGEFTGFVKMNNEEDWKTLETSYSRFILEYAQVAQDLNVEIFCIGTELENFIDARPNYWKQLIKNIKKIYKGKLTYAANWNEYDRTPFWNDLDYVGIDAYFPVSDLKTPTLEDCKKGWEKHKPVIQKFYETHQKPILFTEFGYRSVDFSGKEPWKVDRDMGNVNLEAQTITTRSLFNEFWHEPWFAGGFIWKWFHDYKNAGGLDDTRFTPQNKPVESLIKQYYALYK